jgi:hypothetical protein
MKPRFGYRARQLIDYVGGGVGQNGDSNQED